jgi:YesN/AraC family two-component response regulator
MMKVLIAEDNIIYANAIRNIIDWDRYGFRIVGTASNGIHALNMIKNSLPDIVITDIRMPAMDGIELIRNMKEQYRQIEVIVLSSYDDFEFVKQALKLGASDYILKQDLCSDKMIEVLYQLRGKINAKPELEIAFSMMNNKELLIESFLFRLLDGQLVDDREINRIINELMLDFMFKKYNLYVVKPVKSTQEFKNINGYAMQERSERLYESVKKYIADQSCEKKKEVICIGLKQEHVIILQSQQGVFSQSKIAQRADELYQNIMLVYKTGMHMGVSLINTNISDIHKSYLEAQEAAFSLVYAKVCGVNFYQVIPCGEFLRIHEFILSLGKLTGYEDEETVLERVNSLIDSIILAKPGKSALISICGEINLEITGLCYRNNMDIKQISSAGLLDSQKVNELSSIDEIKSYLIKILLTISENVKDNSHVKSRIILAALTYINENYAKQLSLVDLADMFGCNQNYFSNLFKKETGTGFIEHLNRVRIKKAVELIETRQYKAYEIAELVGFNNGAYFSKIFKEITGNSFSEISKGY